MAGDDTTTAPDAPAAAAPPAPPDWQQQPSHELRCPICDYDLHGLTEPRCPECGFRFEWKDLLDARARPHPYLFEHHLEANFKSFWQTAWGGLRPRKFWSDLHPAMRSRPGRLLLYWCLAMLFGCGAWIGLALPRATALATAARQARARTIALASPFSARLPTPLTPAAQARMEQAFPLPPRLEFFDWLWQTEPSLRAAAALLVLCASWPWLTYAALMVFRFSMRRAKVRSIHVLRCVLYSSDLLLWTGAILLPAMPLAAWAFGIRESGAVTFGGFNRQAVAPYAPGSNQPSQRYFQSLIVESWFLPWASLLATALLAVATIRLIGAYRRYLKFDWPAATVLASQVILLLLLCIVVVSGSHEMFGDELASYWRSLLGLPQW